MSRIILVELFVQADETLAFIAMANREVPRLERLPTGEAALLSWTQQLRRSMQSAREQDSVSLLRNTPLQPLLSAIEQESAPEDMLYFVPHGPLHAIPFHALEVSGAPLIRRNPVAYAPSASALGSITGRKTDKTLQRAIVIGDTQRDLPFANVEACVVAELAGTEPILGLQATKRRVLDEMSAAKGVRLVHLACHGYFDQHDSLASGIVMANEEGTAYERAVLTARDFLERELIADLVTLSACESGIGDRRPGDELFGLTRSILVAGASSVLASLWKVDDLSTSVLMKSFYEAWLIEGLSKAHALRKAQCHVMDISATDFSMEYSSTINRAAGRDLVPASKVGTSASSGDRVDAKIFAAPFHWASFALVGDLR